MVMRAFLLNRGINLIILKILNILGEGLFIISAEFCSDDAFPKEQSLGSVTRFGEFGKHNPSHAGLAPC